MYRQTPKINFYMNIMKYNFLIPSQNFIKKNFLATSIVISFILFPFLAVSQGGVSVSETGALPHNTAALDVQSDSKGFLVPRLTTAQRDGINAPAIALQIYNTSTNCLQIYMPTSGWKNIICDLDEDSISGGCPGILTDIDGNTYNTILLGDQCWTKENLRTTHYADGSAIPNVVDDAEWGGLSSGAWSYYNNDEANNETYGKMYNWFAATDARGLCPTGWHLPTDDEWITMELHLGINPAEVYQVVGVTRGAADNIGGKLKATTTWNEPNTGATNESEFTGFAGGWRPGPFEHLGEHGFWWSASDNTPSSTGSAAWVRVLYYNEAASVRTFPGKVSGISVRCVRD